MTDIATADDHHYELTRYNWRTGSPYCVWVHVTHFACAELPIGACPGADVEIEALGGGLVRAANRVG